MSETAYIIIIVILVIAIIQLLNNRKTNIDVNKPPRHWAQETADIYVKGRRKAMGNWIARNPGWFTFAMSMLSFILGLLSRRL